MKCVEAKESKLGYILNSKKQKRKSYKKEIKLKNRSFRRFLKNNLEIGKEILKKRVGYEF